MIAEYPLLDISLVNFVRLVLIPCLRSSTFSPLSLSVLSLDLICSLLLGTVPDDDLFASLSYSEIDLFDYRLSPRLLIYNMR